MAGYTYFDIGENTGLKGRVYWQSTSNGSNANSSNVYARVEAMKTNAATTGTFTGDVNIDWNAYEFSWHGTLPVNSWTTLKEASRTVGHNSDGTRTCFIGSTVRGPSGTSLDGISIDGSIDARLDTIPRYTSITSFTATSYSETQIKLDYTTADTVSKVEYTRTADVAQPTWITITNDLNAKSGSYIISNLNHNTTYNQIKLRVTRRDSGLTTTSEKKSASTYDYPYSTSAPTFTIGNSFKVKFYNPKSRPITYKIIETRNNKEILTGTTSVASNVEVTINTNTTAIKNKLYENIAQNGSSNTYRVKTIYSSGTAVHSDATGKYNINTTECKPTFTNFAYKDITDNDLTTAIGNNQVLVQGVSSVNLVISSANKMVPKRNATAKSYQYTFNNLNGTVDYSANDIDKNIGVINGSGNQVFSVIANDNRNPSLQSDAVTKTINIIPYALATINVDLHRVNNFEAETKLKLNGTFSRVTVNNADKNLIKNINYRYKETGTSTWANWTAMTISSQGNGSYETSPVTLTLDNSKSFDFEFQVIDRAKTSTSSGTLSVGKPLMFLHTNGNLDIGSHTISNDGANYSGKAATAGTADSAKLLSTNQSGQNTGAVLSGRGANYIFAGPNDAANDVGGNLNNLVLSSWNGVSFTTSCTGQTYTNKNAVSINARNGRLNAASFYQNGVRVPIQRSKAYINYKRQQYTNSTSWGDVNLTINASNIVGSDLTISGSSIKINSNRVTKVLITGSISGFMCTQQSDVYSRIKLTHGSSKTTKDISYLSYNPSMKYWDAGNSLTCIMNVSQNDTIILAVGAGAAGCKIEPLSGDLYVEDITNL